MRWVFGDCGPRHDMVKDGFVFFSYIDLSFTFSTPGAGGENLFLPWWWQSPNKACWTRPASLLWQLSG